MVGVELFGILYVCGVEYTHFWCVVCGVEGKFRRLYLYAGFVNFDRSCRKILPDEKMLFF